MTKNSLKKFNWNNKKNKKIRNVCLDPTLGCPSINDAIIKRNYKGIAIYSK